MAKLNVFERLMLLQILPKEGSIVMLKIMQDLSSKIGFNEAEFKEFDIKQVEGEGVKWNEKGKEEREIEIGEKGKDLIADALKDLDKKKKLTFQHLSIYDKFVKD